MRRWSHFFHEQLAIHVDQHVPDGRSSRPAAGRNVGDMGIGHMQVKLRGVLDIATCQWARSTFDHILDRTDDKTSVAPLRSEPTGVRMVSRAPWWTVDIAELEFLSAGGLTVFEDIAARCRDAGGPLVLVRPNRPVRRVLPFADPRVSQFWGAAGDGSSHRHAAGGVVRGSEARGEESIDGVCTTLVRVIRRCFPMARYRVRWPMCCSCSVGVLPRRPFGRLAVWLLA